MTITLSQDFLAPYYKKGDVFPTLIGRSTYLSKFKRPEDTCWTDTCVRIAEGSVAEDPNCTQEELENLFHAFWTMQILPSGRGLWVTGARNIPVDSRYNCAYITLRSIDDLAYCMYLSACGSGVGMGLYHLDELPAVTIGDARLIIKCDDDHPNRKEFPTNYTPKGVPTEFISVADSREGWVACFRKVLDCAFKGQNVVVDVSKIRQRGAILKTSGGHCAGPLPLVELLRHCYAIIRKAAGRKLISTECLDLVNELGRSIASGGNRRSALIQFSYFNDYDFRNAKKDEESRNSHRWSSNNSIVLTSKEDIVNMDWKSVANDMVRFGDPGILNLYKIWKTDPGVEGCNPCFSSDTRISTQYGLVPVVDLSESQELLQVTTDSRVLENYKISPVNFGTTVRTAIPVFKTSPRAPIYQVVTRRGYTVKATSNHKFVTPQGFIELKDLAVGDNLLLQSGEGQWGQEGTADLGKILGWIEGDGCVTTDTAYLYFFGEKQELSSQFLDACNSLIPKRSVSLQKVKNRDQLKIESLQLHNLLAALNYKKGSVPEVIWRGTRECVIAYLQAIFAADGSVEKSHREIRLCQSNKDFLRQIQVLLQNFGIYSHITLKKVAGFKAFPNRTTGGKSVYPVKENYSLGIQGEYSANRFLSIIGLLRTKHQNTANLWKSFRPYPEKNLGIDSIISIQFIEDAATYCTTQTSHHTVIANGIVTGQCGEINLYDREVCCISEAFPALFTQDPHELFKLLTRYTLRQRLASMSDPKADEIRKRNMRIGVGLGGICDFDWKNADLTGWYKTVRDEADRYADELGVNRPNFVTTCKPSGSVSLLNGSSPGVHSSYAPYYKRRTRISKVEPLAEALLEAGVPYELADTDPTGNTYVFEFPMHANSSHYSVSESVEEQFERVQYIQDNWSDNSVSSTISFEEDEVDLLATMLEKYVPNLKSVSCMSRAHGFSQPPYEEITKEEFEQMNKLINYNHPLTSQGELEIEECQGACPIK